MTTQTAKKTAPRKPVNRQAVHDAERAAGDKIEAQRQEAVEQRDRQQVARDARDSGILSVHHAWAQVMAATRGVGKTSENKDQHYKFRGIDAVMNAVGPAMREWGVMVMPEVESITYRDVRTTRDKPAREVTVKVRYTIIGPAGDTISGVSVGESMDSGDKGTPKAMSVAYRVFLLQALCLPTDETDPDEETYERAPDLTPAEKVAKGLPMVTEAVKIEELQAWSAERGLLDEKVPGPEGPISLKDIIHVHRERIAQRDANVAKATQDAQAEADPA